VRLCIRPSVARGKVTAPPSKSMAHRALIAAALARGESRIFPLAASEDIRRTVESLAALGAVIRWEGDEATVLGRGLPVHTGRELSCGESGSTLRFLLPLCLLTGEEETLRLAPRLAERPLSVYEELCREKGFLFRREGERITVKGRLQAGEYSVPGDVSSQFVTGLLYALSLLSEPSVLRVTGRQESAAYVEMTLSVLSDFGVTVRREGHAFYIPASTLAPRDHRVEGDWSNAAFLEAFSYLGGKVEVEGLREDSLQGDRVYRETFARMARGFATVEISQCPDLGPVFMAFAALHHGVRLTGTARLRIKESDRGQAMKQVLEALGGAVTVEENEILVEKRALVSPKEPLYGHNDHRIVMAESLLLSRLGGEIEGAQAVAKSYPDYFEVIKSLGIEVIEK